MTTLCQVGVKADIYPALDEIHAIENISVVLFIQYALAITMLLVILYLICIIAKKTQSYQIVGIFSLGLLSALMMGFSPTVYVSGPRTFIYLFVITIYVMLYFLKFIEEYLNRRSFRYVAVVTVIIVLRTMYMVMFKQ